MYFPILRGRQNELIAVRDLQSQGRLEYVTPIIEPVKASPTLMSVLKQFRDDNKPIVLVHDPIVGSFEKELSQSPDYRERFESVVAESSQLVKMSYCKNGSPTMAEGNSDRSWAYYLGSGNREAYEAALQMREPDYSIVGGGGRNHRIAKGKRITLESAFVPQKRNADYCEHKDDFLSEEFAFFSEEGPYGFSDYSIVGEEYSEGGFTPKVVALHLVHLNEEGSQLRVRHFTSPADDTSTDTPGKFYSALSELLSWAVENQQLLRPTHALSLMKEVHEEGRFPGLGVAKKLAIMHHLDLVNTLLGERR